MPERRADLLITVVLGALLIWGGEAAMQTLIDLTALPVGDGKISSGPVAGSIWSCTTTFGGGGASVNGPWIKSNGTFDLTTKAVVEGAVGWPHQFSSTIQGTNRILSGNYLPTHTTGIYPIQPTDPAYQYDRNPNSIAAQTLSITLPASPGLAAQARCLPLGAIGVLLTGSAFFNGLDAAGHDAVAHELQDSCQGHPEARGLYHYHDLTACIDDSGTGHSPLVGYAFDGFGIYGHRGENGQVLTDADLDACHGHTHAVAWDGQMVVLYHYHATWEYPYTLGCYRGSGQSTALATATATPTIAPTLTATAVRTATATAPLGAACTPRPTIGVSTMSSGDGRLLVTLTAPSSANDRLVAIQFGAATNALVDVAGQVGIGGNYSLTLPAGTQSLTFYVRQQTAGQAVTVPLVITDSCGTWSTFVGGGSAVFGAASTATPTRTSGPPAGGAGDLAAAASATPTPAPTCTPRPPVSVSSAPDGSGRLRVTVAVAAQPSMRLQALRFGAATNATIQAGSQTGAGNLAVTLPPGTTETTFAVARTTAGQATTVPLTVVDSCGEWPSMVGGGPGAF